MAFTLTAEQEAAYAAIVTLITTSQKELVIEGYAGTGKTTLIDTFMKEWPQFVAISGGTYKDIVVHLTATTNKAADALSAATNKETITIHSLLGLRVVSTGFRESKLVDTGKPVPDGLIIIDEASFIDASLLHKIRQKAKGNKVIFLGDPCQLKPVGSDNTPVFDSGITTVKLSQIVRQADNSPIQILSKALRDHVAGAPMPKAGVDGISIFHMQKEEFEASLIEDCRTHAGNAVRALAWTNQTAIGYNQMVSHALSGNSEIKLGDTVVVNKQIQKRGVYKLPTDSTVTVTAVGQWKKDAYDVFSRAVELNGHICIRQAKNITDTYDVIQRAYNEDNPSKAHDIENGYADLRLMYASTVNKAQGSTYDTVYINLTDIGKCRDQDQVKRMLYVAVSRARTKVVFTGDL